ncbi:MAG TPA: hypothetical protein VGB66_00680 [Longimicrobium sp.]
MAIQLPPDLEEALDVVARRRGTTRDSYVENLIRRELSTDAEAEPAPPGSLAEFLEGYAGVFDSRDIVPGGARLSESTGEQFADILVEKRA